MSEGKCKHGYTSDDCYGCDAEREKARADVAEAKLKKAEEERDARAGVVQP
jgi:hypothetical protein